MYLPDRKTIRRDGADYGATGYYFVTICVANRKQSLGRMNRDNVILTAIGTVAEIELRWLPVRFGHVEIDTFQVMPDHLHAIIRLTKGTPNAMFTREFSSPQAGSLSMVVNHFKGTVTRYARRYVDPEFSWQSRFHDRVIRDFEEMDAVREYILTNPKRLHLKNGRRDMPGGMSTLSRNGDP